MNLEKPELAVITLTPGAKQQARRLSKHMACDCYTTDKLLSHGFKGFEGSMADCVKKLFADYTALLFICATGITVRMIAPLVTDKLADPAILVMDEQAQHVISLLSGHVGGGNKLATQLANLLGATPVITTATDVNKKAALDTLIQEVGADVAIYRQAVKEVNQLLVSDKKVGLYLDEIIVKDTRGFVLIDDLQKLPEQLVALVIVSNKTNLAMAGDYPIIHIVPRNIVVGIGCRRGTDGQLIYQKLVALLTTYHIDIKAVKQIGSVIIKQDEEGLIALAKRLNVPFKVFPIQELKKHEHRFPVSEFVRKTLGVGSVSQPTAWLLSNGHLIGETLKEQGITITLGVSECYI